MQPTIRTSPLFTISAMMGLSWGIFFIFSSTFSRATAATKALSSDVARPLDSVTDATAGYRFASMGVMLPSLTSSTAAFTAPQSL
jgi:hypothetical protein